MRTTLEYVFVTLFSVVNPSSVECPVAVPNFLIHLSQTHYDAAFKVRLAVLAPINTIRGLNIEI